MTQLEKMQYTAKVNLTGAFGLLARFLVVIFAATVSLALPGDVGAPRLPKSGLLSRSRKRRALRGVGAATAFR